MASTNVCWLDSSSSVNLFIVIGLICNFTSSKYIYIILWASRISALLQVAVDDGQMFTSHVCTKCTLGLVALEKAE